MGRLEGKVGIITGAGAGMGSAGAVMFAKEGAKVVVADIDEKSGKETVKRIKQAGGSGIFVKTDVTKEDSVAAVVRTTVDTYGKIDFLYNNAGFCKFGVPTHEVTQELWDKTYDINVKGQWLMIKHVVPQMLKNGKGSIINVSTTSAMYGVPTNAAYDSAKAAVIQLTRDVAVEYGRRGIRVNSICPGVCDTAMAVGFIGGADEEKKRKAGEAFVPIGRIAQPEEIASVALFLASDESSFVTGANWPVDGGMSAD